MYKEQYGTKNQIQFASESDYYEFLGYLVKNDGSTRIVWERNDEQGAWGQEGRIEFYVDESDLLNVVLKKTAGTGNQVFRVNCNEFIQNLINNHEFKIGETQNLAAVRDTVPAEFHDDFNRGNSI